MDLSGVSGGGTFLLERHYNTNHPQTIAILGIFWPPELTPTVSRPANNRSDTAKIPAKFQSVDFENTITQNF